MAACTEANELNKVKRGLRDSLQLWPSALDPSGGLGAEGGIFGGGDDEVLHGG